MRKPPGFSRIVWAFVSFLIAGSVCSAPPASAEYGDIIINNYAEANEMRPVIFPHWFHRIRFRCRVCHTDLGFNMGAGSNKITMGKIINGEFCGACHNGEIAWSPQNCDLCHSGKPGLKTGVKGGHQTTGPGKW